PYCEKHNILARFVRSVDKYKKPLPDLMEQTRATIAAGKLTSLKIPVFGSKGGRLMQSCTSKWKIRAIHQEARRLGATTLNTAQGIHFGEAGRRVNGRVIGKVGEWTIYQDTVTRRVDGDKVEVDVRWCTHYYPMVDRRLGRKDAVSSLTAEGIPFLINSQC